MRALLLALALSACASAPPSEPAPPQLPQRAGYDPIVAARAEGVDFRGAGAGFVLEIFRVDRIRLTLTDTGEVLEFPKPEPQYPRWNGTIYSSHSSAHALTVMIRDDRPCQTTDASLYPTGLEVDLDGRQLTGCGRRL